MSVKTKTQTIPKTAEKTTAQTTEHLQGTIERVTFHNEESGFCVLKVQLKSQRDLITVVGSAIAVQAGEFIECTGVWINNKHYGLQFKSDSIQAILPTTIEGMQKYLASGMIKGIGPGFAKRLIDQFKEAVFFVIENQPHRLSEVPGLGKERQLNIIQAWADQRIIRDIMVFLQSYGVGASRAVRIFKMYGQRSIDCIKENPYRLAQDIHGIGFKTADTLAQKLGIPPDSILRLSAGVIYCLQDIASNGHCGAEKSKLIKEAQVILSAEPELIEPAIEQEVAKRRIKLVSEQEKTYCFLQSLYTAEAGIAKRCQALLKGGTLWSKWSTEKIDSLLEHVQKQTKLTLSASQKEAVVCAIKSKMMIITGGPGVGKTTIVNTILKIISSVKAKIILAAPTGRAAKRLSESTKMEAKTIHRLLAYSPIERQFQHNEDNTIDADLVVIDESSMIDVSLMNSLFKAIHPTTAVLLVGDIDQLPSVGPGAVLQDLILSNVIPTVRLKEIFRQAATSKIITNAHAINQGIIPKRSPKEERLSDFYVMHCLTPEEIAQKTIQLVCERIPKRFSVHPVQDIQVLTPMHKGILGTVSLNIELQKHLNPQSAVITKLGIQYGIGDKVIQNVNNYDKEVYNGDIGFITKIDQEDNKLWISFNNNIVEYEYSDLDEINLAYATSIHKSQGSEYPVVVIPLSLQHYTLLERNLIYTAVTRGKSLVIIIAQSKALALGVRKQSAHARLTYLRQLLEEGR